jgi:hypothetical protein
VEDAAHRGGRPDDLVAYDLAQVFRGPDGNSGLGLGTLMLTDLYILLLASGAFSDPRIFN